MTLEGWSGTPTWTNGQVMSAAAHLNWLAEDVRFVHDAMLGVEAPFHGIREERSDNSWSTVIRYGIRHETDALVWKYILTAPPPPDSPQAWARLKINSVEIPGTAQDTTDNSGETFSGTADLSGLGLTPGELYVIEFQMKSQDGTSSGEVWQLWETDTPSYPGLIAFNDGVTPTAAQWQALSTYAEIVETQMDHPETGMIGRRRNATNTVWFGTLRHRCDDLLISLGFGVRDFYEVGDHVIATVYVNGVAANVITFIVEYVWPYADQPSEYRVEVDGVETATLTTGEQNYTPEAPTRWIGLLDTTAWGLSFGEVYELRVRVSDNIDHDGGPGRMALHYLFETPAGTETVSGYSDPPTWAYADYVYGNSTAKQVQTLAADLAALGAAAGYHNYAAPGWNSGWTDAWTWLTRRHRWLHYLNTDGESPAIRWHDGADWQESSLKDSEGNWEVADLEGFSGLWPGVRYQLNRVVYAIEDSEA